MQIKNTFVHHVYFWLKDKATLNTFIDGVKTLAPISYVKDIHIGVPADTHGGAVDRSYDVSLLTTFNNLADHDAYQVDPIHQEFLAKYARTFCERVMVTDSVDAW